MTSLYWIKAQSSVPLAFVSGNHRWRVDSTLKGPVTRKIFPFDDVLVYNVLLIDIVTAPLPLTSPWNSKWCQHLSGYELDLSEITNRCQLSYYLDLMIWPCAEWGIVLFVHQLKVWLASNLRVYITVIILKWIPATCFSISGARVCRWQGRSEAIPMCTHNCSFFQWIDQAPTSKICVIFQHCRTECTVKSLI